MGKRKTSYHSMKRIFLGNQYTKKGKTFNRTEENSEVKTMKTINLLLKNREFLLV